MKKKNNILFFIAIILLPVIICRAQNIVSSYKWNGSAAPNYSFNVQAGKCYRLVVSGYVTDPDNGGSRDAFYSFDANNGSMIAQQGAWWTNASGFASIAPLVSGYNAGHVYEFDYRSCSGSAVNVAFNYTDVDYSNNVATLQFDWYEMTPCDPNPPSVNLGPDKTSCVADAITLDAGNANSGANYSWSTGATSQKIIPTASGTYSVIVNAYNCTVTGSVKVTLFPELKADRMITVVPTCNLNDGEIVLSGTGGKQPYQYSIDNGSTFSATTTFSNLPAGVYPVVIKDAIGCDDTLLVILDNPSTMKIDTISYTQILCKNDNSGSINVSVSGGSPAYTYQWSGSSNAVTEDLSNLGPGTYIFSVTDQNKCKVSAVFAISQYPPVTLTPSKKDVKCGGQSTGAIDMRMDGGTSPFTFQWSGASQEKTQSLKDIPKGDYTLTVTDKNNCTTVSSVTITEPPPLKLTSSITPVCGSPTAGAIDITVSGGIPGYTYQWSGNSMATTEDISKLTIGTYQVTVKDAIECEISDAFNLVNFDLVFSTSGCPQQGSVNIDLTVTNGGTAPFSYQWSTGANTEDLSGVGEGTFSVEVIDANQCYGEGSTQVTALNTPCIIIPNVFSPNGDNVNDTWNLKGIENYNNPQVSIYNRWGSPIMYKSDYKTPWDGKQNGMELPTASYYYVIELNKGQIIYKGYLTLKR